MEHKWTPPVWIFAVAMGLGLNSATSVAFAQGQAAGPPNPSPGAAPAEATPAGPPPAETSPQAAPQAAQQPQPRAEAASVSKVAAFQEASLARSRLQLQMGVGMASGMFSGKGIPVMFGAGAAYRLDEQGFPWLAVTADLRAGFIYSPQELDWKTTTTIIVPGDLLLGLRASFAFNDKLDVYLSARYGVRAYYAHVLRPQGSRNYNDSHFSTLASIGAGFSYWLQDTSFGFFLSGDRTMRHPTTTITTLFMGAKANSWQVSGLLTYGMQL